jgi:methanogenic corrinoid protein MtbC1
MRARLTELLLAGDWRQSQILVRASGTPSQRADFFEKALRDSLYEVGSQWETGTISVAREHLATATVARLLAAMPVVSDAAVTPKGKAIVTATANEHHQVGAWLIADALEADGWDVRFLGANTPEQELLALLREECPDLLLLSATLPFNLRHVQNTIQAARCLPECHNTRILVGGQAFAGEPDLDRRLGADGTGKDCRDAVAQAALWWGERTGGQ